ncbi:UbiD family decarboxylase [Methanopyrus sp.]
MRDFLRYVENDLVVIEERLSPEYEVPAVLQELDRPIVFEGVEGYDIPLVGNLCCRREYLVRAMGAESWDDVLWKLAEAMDSPKEPRRERSPSFLEVERGPEFLEEFPMCRFYRTDGGPYLTASLIVAVEPEEGIPNASVHRMMYLGDGKFAVRIVPRHLHRYYEKADNDLPVAVCLGVDPRTMFACCARVPYEVSELDVAAAFWEDLRVYEVDYDIPIPAESEIVMVGRLTPERAPEGPFVDVTRTLDERRHEPVFEVEKVYTREDPYHPIILPGGEEHRIMMGGPTEATILAHVSRVSEVVKVRLTPGGGRWLHAVVSIRKRTEGEATNAGLAALAAHPSLKHVVVVDEDVDPDDPEQVEYALATRFQADRDLHVVRGLGSTLDPSAEEGIMAKAVFDATAPVEERELFEVVEVPVSDRVRRTLDGLP